MGTTTRAQFKTRSVLLALSAAAAMIIAAVAAAGPASADTPTQPGQCTFDAGSTICTDRQAVGSGTELVSQSSYSEFCGVFSGSRTVTVATYRRYTDYHVTQTTYAGKGPHITGQYSSTVREYGYPYTVTYGGC